MPGSGHLRRSHSFDRLIPRSNASGTEHKAKPERPPLGPSRPGKFHPESLTDPDLNLSGGSYSFSVRGLCTAISCKFVITGCDVSRLSGSDGSPLRNTAFWLTNRRDWRQCVPPKNAFMNPKYDPSPNPDPVAKPLNSE
jgi:hypothetical protein